MLKMNKTGQWEPTKLFPCECGGEGVTMSLFVDEDDWDPPYFSFALWQQDMHWGGGSMPWKLRLRCAWSALCGKPWKDQVIFTPGTARNFANHILYQLNTNKEAKKKKLTPEPSSFFSAEEAK